MRPRFSIRESVGQSVGWSICRSVMYFFKIPKLKVFCVLLGRLRNIKKVLASLEKGLSAGLFVGPLVGPLVNNMFFFSIPKIL